MKKIILLFTISLIMGCEKVNEFNSSNSNQKIHLVANSVICADSVTHTIEIMQSNLIFFENNNYINSVKSPTITVNEESVSLTKEIATTPNSLRFSFNKIIKEGNRIVFNSNSEYFGEVTAIDSIPRKIEIKNVTASQFYIDGQSFIRAKITIKDIANENNFYRVNIRSKREDSYYPYLNEWSNEDIYTDQEPLFSSAPIGFESGAHKVNFRIFTDDLFCNKEHTLNLYFRGSINQGNDDSTGIYTVQAEIQTISEALYNYLYSLELLDSQDATMEPLQIYTNLCNGYGILGCYNTTTKNYKIFY